jgi:ankyrin repeat protein
MMVALIGLRGLLRDDSFELFCNRDDAGNFDDIVYTAGGQRYFIQLKHAERPDKNKLTKKDLKKLLPKCFEYYCKIKQNDTFKDIPVENSQFIIYTNKELTPELQQHERTQTEVDILFKTCEKGEIFSFSPDKKKQTDVYTLLENALKKSKDSPESCNRTMVNEFLNKLIMVTGQKGRRELDELIDEGIRKHDVANVDNDVYKTELLGFKTQVEKWCRDGKEQMTETMFRNWLQDAKTKACAPVVRSLFKSFTKNFVGTGMAFSDSEVLRLQAKLPDKRAVHLKSDALPLCSILLLDCLHTSKCIFVTFESLQSNKNMLLHAWLGGHWEWLIVFCDSAVQQSDFSDTCIKISDIIQCASSNKPVIILTSNTVQEIREFVPIEHKFNFEQLSKQSQEIALHKTIDFQGCEVTMRSVLQRHGNVQHVLGPELVTDLITEGTAVNIGSRLQVNEGFYAPRELERYIWLHSNILQNSNDIFAVSGIKEEDLLKTVPSGKSVEYWVEVINSTDFTQDMSSRIFLLSDEDGKNSFLAICKKLEGNTLHWVEFKDGDLLWKMSRGSTDSLLDYIDDDKTRADKKIIREWLKSGSCEFNEDLIRDLGERTVLLIAKPGMGKSSTTTQVAWHTKLADPTSWVVRINWNDHTTKLQEIDAETLNFDSLVEFLCSAAFPKSKYTDIERILLKQALQCSGNVTVLMDGFDEISPMHADKAAVILFELIKTKVKRVWVTSRPVQKERLEKELSVIAFSLKRLSRESQKEMLRNLWMYQADENENELNNFLLSVNRSVHDENFTGSPLYIRMIATIHEMDRETFLNSVYWFWPEIDLVKLYEVSVENTLRTYLREKLKANISNCSFQYILEYLNQKCLEDFEKCALVAILPPSMLQSLHLKNVEEEIKPFLDYVQVGKDKIGIVMNVVDGKPQFLHRTFAEYLTARWFSRNFEYNRKVLKHILFKPEYIFVRKMFDLMLAKGYPLHFAVIRKDKKRFKTLLKEGCDVSILDKGGRTVVHYIAERQWIGWWITKLNFNNEASLHNTDSVLQWTPLQYAVNSENWFIVDTLLNSSVDRFGLDMIRQRAHDTNYIAKIILESAEFGYLLLLDFLCSIGVNIHQASSTDFPTPLHAAIQGEQLPVVRWLIQHGADCNTRYSDGQTPLFHAVTESSLDVVRALVEEGGASLDIRDDNNETAIGWAKRQLWDANDEKGQFRSYNTGLEVTVEYLEKKEHGDSKNNEA